MVSNDKRNQSLCVVVVTDDSNLRRVLTGYLDAHSVHALSAPGLAGLQCYLARSDLLVLDLPYCDRGLDVLREIRLYSPVPVILTSDGSHPDIDATTCLEIGADDYIIKPFSHRELVARIRAVLRAIKTTKTPAQWGWQFGAWTFDPSARLVMRADGVSVPLSESDCALLGAFLQAPQRPLTREHLLQAIGKDEDNFDRSIDTQVLRLRRKLTSDPDVPCIIQTERGVGYTFMLPVLPC